MKGQRLAMYAGVLAAAIGFGVTGLAARAGEAQTTERRERADRDRRDQPRVFMGPDDRRVIRLDGRGSQIGVLVSDPENATDQGVAIDRVDEDGPAEKAGVREGDRVVEFDGEKVRSTRQLTRLVQETPSGRTVKMTVLREGDRRTLDITPTADRVAGNFEWRMDRDLEREIERGVEQGLRELPRRMEPLLNFRFDDMPGFGMRGRLGVQVQPLNEQLGEYFGAREGVLVSSVTPDSPAAKAGVKAGDVITRVNGEGVKDTGDLVGALADVKEDGAVSLDIVRDKKSATLKATIERPRPSTRSRGNRPA